jgi:hypothetical protein
LAARVEVEKPTQAAKESQAASRALSDSQEFPF